MKKHILSFSLVATMIGAMATGCSSANKASGSDTTMKDTTKMTDTTKKMMDTTKKMMDTTKKDTTKKM